MTYLADARPHPSSFASAPAAAPRPHTMGSPTTTALAHPGRPLRLRGGTPIYTITPDDAPTHCMPILTTGSPARPCRSNMFTTYRLDFRGSVTLALGPTLAPQASWSKGAIPTLTNTPDLLLPAARAQCPHWRLALLDTTDGSPLDTPHGHYEPIMADLARATPTTVDAMSQAFTDMIIPLGSARNTRLKAQRNWRSVLTWAVGRHTLDQILPMDTRTLQAMLWDFTAMGASRSVLKSVVDSVISRHRDAQLPSPVTGHMSYFRLTRCLGRLLGTQHPHKMGVTRDMIVALLRYRPKNLLEFRNKLATCTLTIGCMRPGEGARATTCCLVFDSDFLKGLPAYKDCSTLSTLIRKNDQERKGHWMRFGKSADPELDLNFQHGLFMDLAGTRPRTHCQAEALKGKQCLCCHPLFPKLLKRADGSWGLHPTPQPSAANVTAMVIASLRMIGVDTTAFSGVCCRMGGLTVATEAGVPENILWMQSGHAQDRAARRYVRLTNPDRLYDTWRAFRL